jgi:hypothetical protein
VRGERGPASGHTIEDALAVRIVLAVRSSTQPPVRSAESGQHAAQQQEDRLMSRERRPGLGGVSARTTGRSTGGLGVPGKRTLTQGLVQRKARAAASMDPPPVYEESRATIDLGGGGAAAPAGVGEVGHGGGSADRAPATIDAPAAWDESLGRPTIATSASADAAGAVAAQSDAEPGWVQRAQSYHAAHAAAVAAFDRLTGGACVGEDGALDPRKVARWQAEHGVAPDGRVGEATLDAARAAGRGAGAAGGGDRSATSEPVSIDAPAQYDEVDRGTLEVGGVVQRRATQSVPAADTGDPVAVAAAGVEGAAAPLPHLEAIQSSFGPHDVTGVRAQVGGAGADASDALGAEAYATGDRVAFASSPSLHTAAHEAAHVVQQRAGVQLEGGVGQAGDAYEQHADAVADAVVRGERADLGTPSAQPFEGAALQLEERATTTTDSAPAGAAAAGGVGRSVGPTGAVHLDDDGVVAGPSGTASGPSADVAAEPVPGLEHELVVNLMDGAAASLTLKAVMSRRGAGATATVAGEVDQLEVEALRPKLETTVGQFYPRLKAALLSAEYDLRVFEGFTIAVELNGPEATLELGGAGLGDLDLFAIALKGQGDISTWVDLPPGVTLEGELEATFTVGGEMLGKLARALGVNEEMQKKVRRVEAATDELQRAHDQGLHARQRRAEITSDIESMGDELPEGTRRKWRDEIAQLDQLIEEHEARKSKLIEELADLRGALADDAKRLAAATDELVGPARRLGRRLTQGAVLRLQKAIARLLPVLNLVSLVADAMEVFDAYKQWADNQYDLPDLELHKIGRDGEGWYGNSSGPGGGSGKGKEPGAGGAPLQRDDGGTRARRDGQRGGAGVVDPADAVDGGGRVRGPRGVHPIAQRVLRAIERMGHTLTTQEYEALGSVIPEDLTEEQVYRLVDKLVGHGEPARDAYEMLVWIAMAVEEVRRKPPVITSSVGGEPDGATERAQAAVDGTGPGDKGGEVDGAGGEAGEAPPRKRKRRRSKERRGTGARKGPRDGAAGDGKGRGRGDAIVVTIDQARAWFELTADGLVTNSEFDMWEADQTGVWRVSIDGKPYVMNEAEGSGKVTPDGAWDLTIALRFDEEGGDGERVEVFHWLVNPETGASTPVVGEGVGPIAQLVTASPGGAPPRVTSAGVAKFADYELVVVGHQIVSTAPDDSGAWQIQFQFEIGAVTDGATGALLDDGGAVVPLQEGQRFRKSLWIVPAGT